MKRIFVLLFIVLFLAACSNSSEYHEDIRASFAKDTETVRDLAIEAIEEGRNFSESDQEKMDSYISTYDDNLESNDEAHAYLLTRNLIDNKSANLLPSEIENIVDNANDIQIILESGSEAYREAKEKD